MAKVSWVHSNIFQHKYDDGDDDDDIVATNNDLHRVQTHKFCRMPSVKQDYYYINFFFRWNVYLLIVALLFVWIHVLFRRSNEFQLITMFSVHASETLVYKWQISFLILKKRLRFKILLLNLYFLFYCETNKLFEKSHLKPWTEYLSTIR